MMNGYAADFERFRQADRIGSVAPQVSCLPDTAQVIPGEPITGSITVRGGSFQSLAWRMLGSQNWQHLPTDGKRFLLADTRSIGIIELRAVARSADAGETAVTIATVNIAWPIAVVSAELNQSSVVRFAPMTLRLNASWIREFRVISADGSVQRVDVRPGVQIAKEIEVATDAMGKFELRLEWKALDESSKTLKLTYEVLPRPISLAMQYLCGGGVMYRTQHASELELRIPNRGVRMPLPMAGVIEGNFLTPVIGTLRFRDEAGSWCEKNMRLDSAPHTWSQLRGFTSQ